jgi:membrane protein required for beta-lactamase induction
MSVERTAALVAYALCAVGLFPTLLLATWVSKVASIWYGFPIVAVGLAVVTFAFEDLERWVERLLRRHPKKSGAGPSHEI